MTQTSFEHLLHKVRENTNKYLNAGDEHKYGLDCDVFF